MSKVLHEATAKQHEVYGSQLESFICFPFLSHFSTWSFDSFLPVLFPSFSEFIFSPLLWDPPLGIKSCVLFVLQKTQNRRSNADFNWVMRIKKPLHALALSLHFYTDAYLFHYFFYRFMLQCIAIKYYAWPALESGLFFSPCIRD